MPTIRVYGRRLLIAFEEQLPGVFVSGAEELHQGLVLLRIELPQSGSSALVREDLANQHNLDHIDELDVFVHHALDARLQRHQLIRRRPIWALLHPGGQPHWSSGLEFGSRGPGGIACSVI